jgi:hypothetical protein
MSYLIAQTQNMDAGARRPLDERGPPEGISGQVAVADQPAANDSTSGLVRGGLIRLSHPELVDGVKQGAGHANIHPLGIGLGTTTLGLWVRQSCPPPS